MSKLRISDALSLPLDAVTQTFGVLAKRRAGKSYLAARFVEELWAAKQQVVMLDPKGDSWGLRSSADGKSEGIAILILGGEHGDVRLEPSSGEIVARMIVEERVSAILDLSEFRKHEVATFSTAFLETLYRLKAKEQFRTAMMLVVDEADAIAPQRPQRGEERMLGAIEDVVRRGGQRGIGCFMATQRAAVINKNILTQCQVLVALRTIAPQDLAAMEAWIDVHGTPAEREELMASLPSLPTGTAWFWSPGWPTEKGIFACVRVSPRVTFDSGATPKPGETKVAPKTVADVDLGAVQKRMAATIEKAKADDPKELRKRIAELERELKAAASAKAERVEVTRWLFDEGGVDNLQNAVTGILDVLWAAVKTARSDSHSAFGDYRAVCRERISKESKSPQPRAVVGPTRTVAKSPNAGDLRDKAAAASPATDRKRGSRRDGTSNDHDLGKGDIVTLTAVAQHGDAGVTREQLTVLTGYKASSRNTFLQHLSQAELVEYRGDSVFATAAAFSVLPSDFETLPVGDALCAHWMDRLPEGERRVLKVLVERYPDAVAREAIDEPTGYKPSSRNTFLQRLSARKLVHAVGREGVKASAELFS